MRRKKSRCAIIIMTHRHIVYSPSCDIFVYIKSGTFMHVTTKPPSQIINFTGEGEFSWGRKHMGYPWWLHGTAWRQTNEQIKKQTDWWTASSR